MKNKTLSDEIETVMLGEDSIRVKFIKKHIQEAEKELKDEFEDLNLELFLTDLQDKKTKEKFIIPKEIMIILEQYTKHIIEKLNEKLNKIFKEEFGDDLR